ncbi:hypothetical protein DYB25_009815 [Aphanomyces astaci]|uniref:MULE transposase domain-containing protein n=1 Tax=Aphanomyces astaci TaxID=112090 RepID=A0A397A1Q2_APHAT|nr:hypothetical protein DYB25_009815 [Aphanomyces astaci]
MANIGGSPCEVDVIRTPNPSQAIPTLLRHILWPDTGEAAAPLSPPLHPLADLVENVWEAQREVDVLRAPSLSHAIPAHLRHILWPDTGEAASPLSPPLHPLADLVENTEGGSLECDVTGTSSYTWSAIPTHLPDNMEVDAGEATTVPIVGVREPRGNVGDNAGGGAWELDGIVTSSPSHALASLVDYTVDGMWEFDVTDTWGDGAYDTPDFTFDGSNVVDTANDNTGDEIDDDGDEMGDDVILVADFITGPQMSSQARQHEWILVGEFDTYNSARDCVGITTKALLRCMHRDLSLFVFHWDATYKINALAYPVLICGITDPSGNFHPVAFFLIGRESTDEYEWAMKKLMAVYETVVGSCLQLHYVMADAALAPVGTLKTLQPQLGIKAILMCFYHCVACVNKRLGVVPTSVKALVARYLFKVHFSRSVGECHLHRNEAKVTSTILQVDSPTNNPCELFNKHFKGIYTQRTVHGLCATFQLLGAIAVEYSWFKAQPFALRPLPSKKLQQRFRRLVKNGLLEVVPPHPGIVLRSHEVRIRGVIPELAISMAHAFEDEAEDNAF